MTFIQTSGPYLHTSSSVDIDIDYTMFLSDFLKKNPYYEEIFKVYQSEYENDVQPSIEILAKLRDPAISDKFMVYRNNSMLGFDIPPTSLTADESYLVMSTLGNFYSTRDASYEFLDYLSYIKNAPLVPTPLWANSIDMDIADLVGYTPPPPSGGENPIVMNGDPLLYNGLAVFYGLSNSSSGSGGGDNDDDSETMAGYFPTTYFDITYYESDFKIDEEVLYSIILKLKPAHLVFRQFDAIASATIDYKIINPIAQIFSYVGSTVEFSAS